MKRATVNNCKDLVETICNNPKTDSIVTYDENFNLEINSESCDLENLYNFGRVEDLMDWFGIDIEISLTANLKEINLRFAKWLTDEIIEHKNEIDEVNAEEEKFSQENEAMLKEMGY